MGSRNLKDRIGNHPEVEAGLPAIAPASRGGEAVEAGEGYLRDRLGDRLYELANFWLIASQVGDVTYVVGSTRGNVSRNRCSGIVELIRHSDDEIGVNVIPIDPSSGRRKGDEVRGRLARNSNSRIDTITLAWLSKVVDPSVGAARQAGPAAYQEIAAGNAIDLLDD